MPTTVDGANACQTSTLKHAVPYDMQRTPGSDSDTYFGEDWRPDLVNMSFVAKVTWANSDNFLADMLGSHQRSGTKIRRVNPEPHPYYPWMYCVGCRLLRNLGAGTYDAAHNNAIKYDYVEYLCTFAAFLYDVRDDDYADGYANGELCRYIERRSKQIGQSIQTTAATWEYVTAPNNAIPTPPAIHVPYREINYVWRYVPAPLNALVTLADSYYGTVNSATFDSKGEGPDDAGYPAGTLMYMGIEKDPIPSTPAGNRLWTITHKFAFFYHGWNSVYRATGGEIYQDAAGHASTAWDQVRNRAAPTKPPYASNDFLNLFTL